TQAPATDRFVRFGVAAPRDRGVQSALCQSVSGSGRTTSESFRPPCRSAWAMTFLNRLRVLTTALAVLAASAAVATAILGDFRDNPPAARPEGPPDAARLRDELATKKFSELPALTYRLREGETLFAWQVKPTLDPVPPRPRD